MLRQAAVKGYFYPEKRDELEKFIVDNQHEGDKTVARAVIVPHAGYMYSGKTAVKTLSQVKIPRKVLLLGPNHTGFGETVAVYPDGEWETPLGNVAVASSLAAKIKQHELFSEDSIAHVREHSLEVIVPIIRHFNQNVNIVPITMMGMKYSDCIKLAGALAEALADEDDVLIVISSDFNHYESAEKTKFKDNLAIECILRLDPRCLYDNVTNNEISMCGVYPAVVAIETAKRMGAQKGILVEHTHSGVVSGDNDQVVGYAGIILQ